MKIISVEKVISAVNPGQYPSKNLPEIVLVGRSNVGKSSLINSLCYRSGLSRTSGAPGKTRTINFFEVNGKMYLVDLPGYGYAGVSKEKKREWGEFVANYLLGSNRIALIVHLIDLRHEPMKNDIEASRWLLKLNAPYVVLGAKADKVARGKRSSHVAAIRNGLGLPDEIPFILCSCETGEGRDELWRLIHDVVLGY